MKKIGVLLGVMLVSTSVMALDCAYTPEQQLVRDAEILPDIRELPTNVNVNTVYPCGGNLLQLATLRGNPDIMEYLIKRGANINGNVSLKGYDIAGAPDVVPFPLFAARYAPISSLIDLLITYGINVHAVDTAGHDIFWYFEQNPVLRNTYLTKQGYDGLIPLEERIAKARREINEAAGDSWNVVQKKN